LELTFIEAMVAAAMLLLVAPGRRRWRARMLDPSTVIPADRKFYVAPRENVGFRRKALT